MSVERAVKSRAKRYASQVYEVTPMLQGPKNEEGEKLILKGVPYQIEGDIESRVVVSVPETTTMQAAHELEARLQEALGKDVLIITHNMQFLSVKKLSRADGARIQKEAFGDEEL